MCFFQLCPVGGLWSDGGLSVAGFRFSKPGIENPKGGFVSHRAGIYIRKTKVQPFSPIYSDAQW